MVMGAMHIKDDESFDVFNGLENRSTRYPWNNLCTILDLVVGAGVWSGIMDEPPCPSESSVCYNCLNRWWHGICGDISFVAVKARPTCFPRL
ncbi:hypothetical protein CEXT_689761 [Caerostris extrusa]|uniref:Uncharacterized protein n=1 Tax=Caerostris extrusa TaxID=172846 RepID=A0AAV4X6P8_CAEEX|nr:hypothetical protein CEXT_689761 [Caerostris extrusa]